MNLLLAILTTILCSTPSTAFNEFTVSGAFRPAEIDTLPIDWFTEVGWRHRSSGNSLDLTIQHERDTGHRYTDVDIKGSTILRRYKVGVRYADIQERSLYLLSCSAERIWGSDSLHVGTGYERSYRSRWFNSPSSFARMSFVAIFGSPTLFWSSSGVYSRNVTKTRYEAQTEIGCGVAPAGLSLIGNWYRQKVAGAVVSSWAVKVIIRWRVR